MKNHHFVLAALVLFALATSFAFASDPSPLQDFCVATDDPNNAVYVNGKLCKPSSQVSELDFFTSELNVPGNTTNRMGFNVTSVDVSRVPGLNTLGLSFARTDLQPLGQNPPHIHPRATEILVVLEGSLYAGFVSSTSQGNDTLYAKILHPGDVFVFPQGLIHFQVSIARTGAVVYSAFNSQNPGEVSVARSVFGANPKLFPSHIAKAFQLDVETVKDLQQKFQADDAY